MKDTQAPVRRRIVTTSPATSQSIADMREAKRAEDKERFLAILDEHLGIVSYAAAQAGVPRRTVYDWMDNDPEFLRRVKEIDNKQLDFVERKLLENIKANDTRAIVFYCSTKGRHRGYTTRVEITTPENQPIEARVAVDTAEARTEMGDKALAKALKAAMRASPGAFTEASRIAAFNGAVER